MSMITEITGTCSFEGCTEPATHIAAGKRDHYSDTEHGEVEAWKGHEAPACYCEAHATIVADEGSPEFHSDCPNCGCIHGVN